MNLWGNMRRNYYLKRHANFEDFPTSLLTHFRMTGGENWNGLMRECMNQLSCILVTDPTQPLYGQWLNKLDPAVSELLTTQYGLHCSPSPEGTVVYFLFMEVLLAYMLVNLFVGVILDNFEQVSRRRPRILCLPAPHQSIAIGSDAPLLLFFDPSF